MIDRLEDTLDRYNYINEELSKQENLKDIKNIREKQIYN